MRRPRLGTVLFRLVLAGATLALTASEPEYYTSETTAGTYVKKVDVDGRAREYRLHIPDGYDRTRRLPLLFVFHGSSASAAVIERETSMDRLADSLGFIVAYPEGLHRAWNIGECCRFSYKRRIDETGFVSAMLTRLERGLRIDTTRVYVTGYSDGGTLAYLLACRLPMRIAAVAGVSATLFEPMPTCALPHPVPAMVIHGSGDTHIPYSGQPGDGPDSRGRHRTHSAADVTAFWVARDRCETPPTVARAGRVVRTSYRCPAGAEVVFFTIVGGEHGWPGGGRGWIFSPVPPADISATDTIVRFFLRHHL